MSCLFSHCDVLIVFYSIEEASESGIWKSNGKLTGNGKIKHDRVEITTDSEVRLIRPKAIRFGVCVDELVHNELSALNNRAVENDENGTVLYYTTNNSRIYHEKEVEGMEIALEVIFLLLIKTTTQCASFSRILLAFHAL